MRLTQRWINRSVFVLFASCAWLITGAMLYTGMPQLTVVLCLVSATLISGLSVAYWRGWAAARYLLIAIAVLFTCLGLPEHYLTDEISLAVLIPPALALLLTEPRWVVGTIVGMFGILVARSGFQSIYIEPIGLTIQLILYGLLLLSRLATDNAQRLEYLNTRLQEATTRAEQESAASARQAAELAERNQQQQHLLDLVATLETPTICLADGVLLAPLVGSMDSRRAHALTDRLLTAVNSQRARLVILDIAGVTVVDSTVAEGLLHTAQAVRLLGCDVTLTGISPAVALALTQQGIQLTGIATATSPQEALRQYGERNTALHSATLRRSLGLNN